MIAFERRASTVLFNLLRTRRDDRPYLLPANACPILAITLLKAGVPFELVDISERTLLIDPDVILDRARRNERRYAGMIFVRSYGLLTDADEFFREFKQAAPGAIVIDDRCLCPPEFQLRNEHEADAVLYSTGHAKFVDLGWGGYGILPEDSDYDSARESFEPEDLRQLTLDYKRALESGVKFVYSTSKWLDEREPPISWSRYAEFTDARRAEMLDHKRHLNEIYRTGIPAELQYPEAYQQWRFNLRIANPPQVLAAIFAAGLFASQHYVPLTRAFGDGAAANAEATWRHVINLFNDQYLSAEQASHVAEIVKDVAIPLATVQDPFHEVRYA